MTSAISPDPPKTPKAVATRRRLLEVAHRLFIDKGYEAVSLNDIAERAELTKGAIYGHFRSKGQLLVEVIRTELADRDHDDTGSPVSAGAALMPVFVAEASRELRLLQVDAAAAARHDADVAEGLRDLMAARQVWIAEMTAQAAAAVGHGGEVDADTMAFIVTALALGIGVHEAVGNDPPDPETFAAVIGPMLGASFR
ncbi:MAG: TetR/AcrR family transcriptional regulator [Acidimicrobiales bacterium]